ncbi:MAG: hypothetical protein ABJG15_05265 [Hyphomonadaceae bacterium]
MSSQCDLNQNDVEELLERPLPAYASAAQAVVIMATSGRLLLEKVDDGGGKASDLSEILSVLHFEASRIVIDALIDTGQARLLSDAELEKCGVIPRLVSVS